MDHDQLKRMKDLEKQKRRVKKLVSNLALDKDILEELS